MHQFVLAFFLPFQINKAANYLFYFYGGYVVYKHSKNIKIILTPKHLLWAWILFAAIFAALRLMRDILVYPEDASKIYKFAIHISNKACQIVYASIG